jgi:hypothetical protein
MDGVVGSSRAKPAGNPIFQTNNALREAFRLAA